MGYETVATFHCWSAERRGVARPREARQRVEDLRPSGALGPVEVDG